MGNKTQEVSQDYDKTIRELKSTPISKRQISPPKQYRPKIPEGWYQARIIGYETSSFIKQGKLLLYFEITEGPHIGVPIFMAFEVVLTGPPGINGRFNLKGPRSKLAKFLYRFNDMGFDDDIPAIDQLSKIPWSICIKNPEHDYQGEFIPEDARYSKVEIALPSR